MPRLPIVMFSIFSTFWLPQCLAGSESPPRIRVAVIGGLEMSGFWPQLEPIAEQALGVDIILVMAAPKERVVPAFSSGEADVLLIHGGDEAFALEALGYAGPLQTWGYNEFVIVGPASDPAGIAAVTGGVEAMGNLQASGAPLIAFRDVASQQIIRRLLDRAGLFPRDINLINDRAGRPQEILQQAARDQAYVIVGHMPVAFDRMGGEGTKILLQGDPAMRRGYSVLTPGPRHPANEQARKDAARFADFLVSTQGQAALESIRTQGAQWILKRDAGHELIRFE